jgi:hypothetical protein
VSLGSLEHILRTIERDHLTTRQTFEQFRRQPTGAAARIQHSLVAGQHQSV